MKSESAEKQLHGFLRKYTPEIAALAGTAIAKLRRRLPGACVLVYDNYNALAVGFGPSERASEAIFSIAVFPRWVSLFFLQGARLPDPQSLLRGSGKKARHIVLQSAASLDVPGIRALMAAALKSAGATLDRDKAGLLFIKSISKKQRPRRPTINQAPARTGLDHARQSSTSRPRGQARRR